MEGLFRYLLLSVIIMPLSTVAFTSEVKLPLIKIPVDAAKDCEGSHENYKASVFQVDKTNCQYFFYCLRGFKVRRKCPPSAPFVNFVQKRCVTEDKKLCSHPDVPDNVVESPSNTWFRAQYIYNV